MNNRYFLAIVIGVALTITVPMMLSQQTQSISLNPQVFEFEQSTAVKVKKSTESNPTIIVQSLNIPLKKPFFVDGFAHPVLYFYLSAETKKDPGEFTGVPRFVSVNLEVSVDNGNSWKTIGQASGLTTDDALYRDGTGGFASPVDVKTEITQLKYRITAIGNGEVTNLQAYVIPLIGSIWAS